MQQVTAYFSTTVNNLAHLVRSKFAGFHGDGDNWWEHCGHNNINGAYSCKGGYSPQVVHLRLPAASWRLKLCV